jgi:hypothetical protein
MPSKQQIIDNVSEYSAAQLTGYIRDGVVTFEELCGEPDFAQERRKEVLSLIANAEEDAWQNALAIDSIDEYDLYLRSYPDGKHRSEARDAKKRLLEKDVNESLEDEWSQLDKTDDVFLRNFIMNNPDSPHLQEAKSHLKQISRKRYAASAIKRLKNEIEGEEDPTIVISVIKKYLSNNEITLDQLYDEIKKNTNLFPAVVIDQLEQEGIIDFVDMENECGINPKFFEFITNNDVNSPVINVNAGSINAVGSKTTEIYFWGIPSSGKTCALGAIMGEARHGGYVNFAEPNIHCQGYEYMTILSQIFDGGKDVFKLPEGTQTDAIFEMSYILKKDGMDYPVTFIDLAGETIESMFRKNAQLSLTDKKQRGLDTACKLLTGNAGINRKIHFFVLEYNGHQKTYKDLTQDTLLTGAMAFIKDTGIFKAETDAIYLLVTKSDLADRQDIEHRNQVIGDYIKKYYKPFYDGLRSLCVENEINEGNVDIVPFSLGDVCFQNLCLFDNSTASIVVELILEHTKGFKTGKLAGFLKKLKG